MTEDGMPTSGMDYCDLVIRPRVGVRRPKPPRFKGSKAAKRAARLHRR